MMFCWLRRLSLRLKLGVIELSSNITSKLGQLHGKAKPAFKLRHWWQIHITIYVNVITYPCPNLNADLVNIC